MKNLWQDPHTGKHLSAVFYIVHCTTIHRYPIFSMKYSVICKVYTGYHGTSEIEHGLCACTVDNPLAKIGDYLSVQTHKPCSISHLPNIVQSFSFPLLYPWISKSMPGAPLNIDIPVEIFPWYHPYTVIGISSLNVASPTSLFASSFFLWILLITIFGQSSFSLFISKRRRCVRSSVCQSAKVKTPQLKH